MATHIALMVLDYSSICVMSYFLMKLTQLEGNASDIMADLRILLNLLTVMNFVNLLTHFLVYYVCWVLASLSEREQKMLKANDHRNSSTEIDVTQSIEVVNLKNFVPDHYHMSRLESTGDYKDLIFCMF